MSPAATATMKHFFGATCGASVWICPHIQRQWSAHQLQPMSSLFLLDVYACCTLHSVLSCKSALKLEIYFTKENLCPAISKSSVITIQTQIFQKKVGLSE